MDIFGRKAVQYIMDIFICVGWLIIPFARNIAGLYAARFIQGISIGNVYIMVIILAEYVHPYRRGYFITLKKLAIAIGAFLCHAMSAFWTWRQIAIFAAVPPLIAIIMVFFWPESPSHLALKGKFEECEKSFTWLMGNSVESHRELQSLIETQRKKNESNKRMKNNLVEFIKKFLRKDFQKPFLISSILTLALELCGRYFIVAYAIQIMTEIVSNQTSALYFTLGADFFILIALSFSNLVITFFNRRTILLTSGIFSVFLMFLISISVYANTIYSFSNHFLWLIALILILQCFIVNLGLIPVSFTLVGEIFKLEHKSLATCVSSLVFTSLNALILKVTPIMIKRIGVHGTYGVFGVILAISLVILHITVPETKDKTLQEIENKLNASVIKEALEMEMLMN